MNIVIRDNGLFLRTIEHTDTDNIVRWRNSEEVRSHFIDQRLFTVESHEKWLQNYVETGKVVQLIICISPAEDRIVPEEEYIPVGSVYLRDIDETHRKGEYGIFIGESKARGRGIGTKTAKLMLRYCFETLHMHRVYLRVFADNLSAVRSYEKAGFKQEALLHDDVCVRGEYRDIILMGALNPAESN